VAVYYSSSEEETVALGRQLAVALPPKAVVLLIGDLGAGKTTLAKGIVQGLGAAEPDEVSSPTFTLVHEYGERPKVYHVDLYRIGKAQELESVGLEELLDREAVVLVEWGERFPRLWPTDRIEIHLRRLNDDRREIRVEFAASALMHRERS
jgi:tRNA threonylcarbamoyladenosine biosynthesis protein TsaE